MSIISILPEKFTGAFEVIVSMVSVTESSYTCVPLMLTDMTSVVVSSPTVGGMEADCLHCVALIAPTCGTRYALKYVDMLMVPRIELTIGSEVTVKIGTSPVFGSTSANATVASGRARCNTDDSASSPST